MLQVTGTLAVLLMLQVTGTLAVLDMPSKVPVRLLRHLLHHRSRVLGTMVMMMRVQQMLVVEWYVTRTVRMCALPDRVVSETCCRWSQMMLEARVPVLLLLWGPMKHQIPSRNGSMTTPDITTTPRQLVLSPSTALNRRTGDHLYSNSINCSVSVNVTFIYVMLYF